MSRLTILALGVVVLANDSVGAQSAATATAPAAPFGLRMGMSRTELSKIGTLTPIEGNAGAFTLSRVPGPHEAFESYVLTLTEQEGLCRIAGIGKTISSNSHGTQLQSAFESLESALEQRYGPHKKHDFLASGSIWDDPPDWMMALYRKERFLTAFWQAEQGSTMAPTLTAIMLDTSALSSTRGYLRLIYEFTNTEACDARIAKRSNSVL